MKTHRQQRKHKFFALFMSNSICRLTNIVKSSTLTKKTCDISLEIHVSNEKTLSSEDSSLVLSLCQGSNVCWGVWYYVLFEVDISFFLLNLND